MSANVPAKKSRFGWALTILGVIIVLPVIGIGVALVTFDADQYRGDIAQMLGDKLGRKVTLNGPMHLSITQGLALEINDATVANPSWASRPDLARVGKLALSLRLAPLLRQELAVDSVVLNDADVQLETAASGAKNWEFEGLKASGAAAPAVPRGNEQTRAGEDKAAGLPIALNINEVRLKNVRLAMRDARGAETAVLLSSLTLQGGGKTVLRAEGVFNQQPFMLALNAPQWQDLLSVEKNWPFKAEASYAGNNVKAQGNATHLATLIDVSALDVRTAFGSAIDGHLNLNLLGKPQIGGTLHIDRIDLGKLGQPATAEPAKPAQSPAPGQNSAPAAQPRLFSDAKLDLAGLKAANANLRVGIDTLVGAPVAVAGIDAIIYLTAGNLDVQLKANSVAGNPMTAKLNLNAGQAPAALKLTVAGHNMDLNSLLQSVGALGIKLGKTDLDADLLSRGDSMHGLASNLDGKIVVQTGRGTLPLQALKLFAGNLIRTFLPGADAVNDLNLTCGTVRFVAQNGVLTSNGILLESNLATFTGNGAINLGQENLNLTLQPHPKDASLGNIAPALRVGGALAAPVVRLDTTHTVTNLAGELLGANVGGGVADRVPVVNPQAVGNPCADALDHPVYATTKAAPNSVAGKALEKGRSFVQDKTKGLLGKVLGGDKSPFKGLLGQ